MSYCTSANARITGPLPRPDILAICAYLGNHPSRSERMKVAASSAEGTLERLAAAARMQ